MHSHESQKIRNSLVRQQPAFSQIFAPLFFFALFYPIFAKKMGFCYKLRAHAYACALC